MKVLILSTILAVTLIVVMQKPEFNSSIHDIEIHDEHLAKEYLVGPAGKTFVQLPSNAFEIRKNLYFIGSQHYRGENVEGYVILRFLDEQEHDQSHPFDHCNDLYTAPEKGIPQFDLFGKYVRWYWSEGVTINPRSKQGFARSDVISAFRNSISQWEKESGYPLLGKKRLRTTSRRLEADLQKPDEINEVYFAPISGEDIISMTVIWGVFSEDIDNSKLISWDQVYDDEKVIWSIADPKISFMNPNVVGFDKISYEELGYAFGLKELCPQKSIHKTMYGFVH